jgi:hypothetical protein
LNGLTGKNIKIAGESKPINRLGVSFFSPGSPNITILVTENLVLNEASKIIGIVPDLPNNKEGHSRVRLPCMAGDRSRA